MTTKSLEDLLSELFAEQRLAVVATQELFSPHLSLMGFAPTPDLGTWWWPPTAAPANTAISRPTPR